MQKDLMCKCGSEDFSEIRPDGLLVCDWCKMVWGDLLRRFRHGKIS